jgi:uncharacterized protein YcnI
MRRKILASSLVSLCYLVISVTSAFAHVVVNPNQVGIGKLQTFTIGVPNEKDTPTVTVRLVLPDGLEEVTPTVKPGWTIALKKDGEAVQEISWTGGSIPSGQRDEFSFSAKVPDKETTLNWKAYQTYQDGSVVSWDQTLNGSDEARGDKGPYSETKVVNDLSNSSSIHWSDLAAYTALIISVLAFWLTWSKKKA